MAERTMAKLPCSVDGCDKPNAKLGMCGAHYQKHWKYGDARYQAHVPNDGRCSVAGCEKPPRSPTSPHCEMHYGRLRRNGVLHRIDVAAPVRVHSHGYILVHAPDHPMTTESKVSAYQHRVVFFDAHGAGPFNCHVCGKEGMLSEFHVDHLNEDKTDNRLENLKPACPLCNQWRGKTREEAQRKSPRIRWLEHDGQRLPISEWARRLGIKAQSIHIRLQNGWPLARALTEARGRFGPKSLRR